MLVSVIVPVYNVEDYLHYAMESLFKQTYKNIEIILVNDGSTDSSGELCESYAREDLRVTVYHKKNGGLSDARNFGIDKANGEWITFLDPDDYLESFAIEYMVNVQKKYNVELVVTRLKEVNNHNISSGSFYEIKNEGRVVSSREALFYMYNAYMGASACGKLYSKKILDNVKFPKGRIFEDLFIVGEHISGIGSIYISELKLYNYFVREGSITRTKFSKKQFDYVLAIEYNEKIIEESFENDEILKNELRIKKISAYIYIINSMIDSKKEKLVKDIFKGEFGKFNKQFIKARHISKKNKIRYIVVFYFPKIYYFIRVLYRKLWRKNRW